MSSISSTVWSLKPHTKAKHEILENYLKAWFPILSRYSGRIIYLDGFAGPGIYKGNEDGSPVIALKTAKEHSLKHMFKEIIFIFIEKNADRAAKLTEVLNERFPDLPKNIKYHIIGAEFAPTLEQVLQEIEKNDVQLAPTFAFLDPFGFSGFPMKLIGRMMEYNKCEVLISFMVNFVRRFNDELREPSLNELFATEDWKTVRDIVNPEDRVRFLLNLYEQQFKTVGGAQFVRSFGMTGEHNQPIYYLVFGTKHAKGLEVIKKAMWKVDRRGVYKFSDLTDKNQTYLLDYSQPGSDWILQASKMVYNNFRGKTVEVSNVWLYVITETPYINHKQILRHLEGNIDPPKICGVVGRKRNLCYPDGCLITFED